MKTNDIIESMKMAAISKRPFPNILMHEISQALQERDELRDRLEQINETHQNVMSEKCYPDEHHCACVPFLRRGVATATEHLRAIVADAQPSPVPGGHIYQFRGDCIVEAERWLDEVAASEET